MKRRGAKVVMGMTLTPLTALALVWVGSYFWFVNARWNWQGANRWARCGLGVFTSGDAFFMLPHLREEDSKEPWLFEIWVLRVSGYSRPKLEVVLRADESVTALPEISFTGVRVPILWPFAALSLLLAVQMIRRPSLKRPAHCPACGYDLRATPGRCPECGLQVVVADAVEV